MFASCFIVQGLTLMVEGREQALKTTLKLNLFEDVVYMILYRFPFDFGVDFRCLGGVLGGLGGVLGGLGASWGARADF